jgi:uncharacterized protein YceH (UPF0502 family)
MLPRQPGTKESRYMHLFSGEPAEGVATMQEMQEPHMHSFTSSDRLTRLEEEVVSLRRELADVQQQLATFRKQFE